MSDYNQKIIEEFRANAGRVGGSWAGRDLLLLTTTGRKSGRQLKSYVTSILIINILDINAADAICCQWC